MIEEFSNALIWLVAALILGGLEMIAGTFYLLVLAAGAVVAAALDWFGLSLAWQCSAFGGVVIVGGVLVRRLRLSRDETVTEAIRLQNLDEGQMVVVHEWRADGTALVDYRGASWVATVASGEPHQTGNYLIKSVQGARLVLKKTEDAL